MEATRAIGIVRVSEVGGRDEIHTLDEQRERIEALCVREGWRLVAVHEERDVSGGALLADRPGLSQAVTAVLTGHAERLASAYTDRLWRSTEVRSQVVRLVEAAGCEVWSAEEGRISNRNGADKFSGTVRTAADELYRDQISEKSAAAQARAVKLGYWMSPYVPVGYLRADKRLAPDPKTASVIADAFRVRDGGATVADVRAFLLERGIAMTYAAVTRMLANRAYLGELHFGKLSNLSAHPAIVDTDTFRRVQRVRVSSGRRARSERLLARLGVLRCGSCGARMSATSGHSGTRPMYRCGSHVGDDCPQPVTISAPLVEGLVVDRVRAALADVEGRASVEDNAREADAALERARLDVEAAARAFSGFEDETAVRERLAELSAARDLAQEQVDHLGSHRSVVTINAARDWDRLSLDARRALVRAVVAEVRVAPGRGVERVTVELVGE